MARLKDRCIVDRVCIHAKNIKPSVSLASLPELTHESGGTHGPHFGISDISEILL